MPFVQGRLRNQSISIAFTTQCAYCGESMTIEIDDRLRYEVGEAADPLVFVPLVDFNKLKEPSIIDAF